MIKSETLKDPRVGGNLSNIILISLHIELFHSIINQIRNKLHFRFAPSHRRPYLMEKHIIGWILKDLKYMIKLVEVRWLRSLINPDSS